MVRKQLYLEERQDRALKEAAAASGLSEAELVRRALDRFLGTTADLDALGEFLDRGRAAAERHRLTGPWDRANLHQRTG
ncbi:MAG: CopG family transcriptional regulator [Actinomycetota bacterium]